jgi:hypothetical protein
MKNTISKIILCVVAVLAIAIVPAKAAITSNESNPIVLSFFVPCAAGGAGEIVDLSGNLHTLIHETINGNNVSGDMHFQPQGVSGTGETTGLKYQATGVTQTSFKQSLQNGQANMTFINRFDIIGQGPGNNFTVHETAHITFNADGTVTVFFDNFSVECK